jgi:hypothetical protein
MWVAALTIHAFTTGGAQDASAPGRIALVFIEGLTLVEGMVALGLGSSLFLLGLAKQCHVALLR